MERKKNSLTSLPGYPGMISSNENPKIHAAYTNPMKRTSSVTGDLFSSYDVGKGLSLHPSYQPII